jgi:hypothetical protein
VLPGNQVAAGAGSPWIDGAAEKRACLSITIDFDQTFVNDAEVVGYFVEDNPPHLPAKALRV